jgi:hypothetical protein
MSAILEFIMQLFGEIALHSGFWRFGLCLMSGFAIAGIVWWKMPEGTTANAIAVGAIVTMSVIGVIWERSAD